MTRSTRGPTTESAHMKRAIVPAATHIAALAAGFALGVYTLPILTAPLAPSAAAVQSVAGDARYRGEFRRDLADSDALHWGDGRLFVGTKAISLEVQSDPIAPVPRRALPSRQELS